MLLFHNERKVSLLHPWQPGEGRFVLATTQNVMENPPGGEDGKEEDAMEGVGCLPVPSSPNFIPNTPINFMLQGP